MDSAVPTVLRLSSYNLNKAKYISTSYIGIEILYLHHPSTRKFFCCLVVFEDIYVPHLNSGQKRIIYLKSQYYTLCS